MREPYQMDWFDLEENEHLPVTTTPPIRSSRIYVCPKCGEYVGMYSKEGKDKGWHDIKEECRNGHRMNWSKYGINR